MAYLRSSLCLLLSCQIFISAKEIGYQPTTEDFPNPERGFYVQKSVSSNTIRNAREDQNITLLRTYFRLDDWVHAPLPQSFLDDLDDDLNTVRQGGAKIIPRFSYNFGRQGTDAPLDRVLAHIDQVGPILAKHADIIAFMEAGFIGAWGEWHSSDFDLDNNEARTAILFKLLDVLPEERMVAIRYARWKREIYDTVDPLEYGEGFSGSNRARTGAHNDCLGAAIDDWGTYQNASDNEQLQWQKDYLNQDNRYLPQGGETCNVSEYSVCEPILADMERMRWDVINIGFHGGVIDSWRSGGCFDEIERSLGHRLSLISASLADSVRPGHLYTGTLQITNTGWGKIYNPRHVEMVFRNVSSGDEFTVPIHRLKDPSADPRYWLKGDTVSFSFQARIPADAVERNYKLFLNLPDAAESLRDRPEYSIRLANQGVWENSTGYNSLLHDVVISQDAPLAVEDLAPEGRPRFIKDMQRTDQGMRFSLDLPVNGNYEIAVNSLTGKKLRGRIIIGSRAGMSDFEWISDEPSTGVFLLVIRDPYQVHSLRFTMF